MRHCQAGSGAQRCLSLHLCRGGRMMIFWIELHFCRAYCMPVVLVEAAHQLNPSQRCPCVCRLSGAPACPVPNRKVRRAGTRPREAGRFGSFQAAARWRQQTGHHDANISIPGCDKDFPGSLWAALFENTVFEFPIPATRQH